MNPDAKEFIPSSRRREEEGRRMISYQLENNQSTRDQYNNNRIGGAGVGGPINHNNVAAHTSAQIYNHRGVTPKKGILVADLEKFIKIVTPEPSLYDTHVKALVDTAVGWMDEDDSVANAVVNKIVDAALFHKEFRFNAVRLCEQLNNDTKKMHGPVFNKALIEK